MPTILRRLYFFVLTPLLFLTSAVPRAAVDVNIVGVRIARKCGLPQIDILFLFTFLTLRKNLLSYLKSLQGHEKSN